MDPETGIENKINLESSEVWAQLDAEQKEIAIRMLAEMAFNFVMALSKDINKDHCEESSYETEKQV